MKILMLRVRPRIVSTCHARTAPSSGYFGSTNAPGGSGPFSTTSSNVIVFVSPLANVIRMVLSNIDS